MSSYKTVLNPLTLKFSYLGEIRKLSAISNYQEMIDTVQQAYGFDNDAFTIKYKDDEGDEVTVSNDDDYVMALEGFAGKVPKFIIEKQLMRSQAYSIISHEDIREYTIDKKYEETKGSITSDKVDTLDKDYPLSKEESKKESNDSIKLETTDIIDTKHSEAIKPVSVIASQPVEKVSIVPELPRPIHKVNDDVHLSVI